MEWLIIMILGWTTNYGLLASEQQKYKMKMKKHLYVLALIPYALTALWLLVRLLELLEQEK